MSFYIGSDQDDEVLLAHVLGEELLKCGHWYGGYWTHMHFDVSAVVDGDRVGVWEDRSAECSMVLTGLGDPDLVEKVRGDIRGRIERQEGVSDD